MFCPSCGSENPGNAQFCGGCGQRITITSQQPGVQAPVPPAASPVPVAPAPPQVVNTPPEPSQAVWESSTRTAMVTPPATPQFPQPPIVPAPPAAVVLPNVPTHLVLAIIATLCCGCPPLGIISLIFALQVSGKLKSGDIAGAQRASSRAKMWGIIGIILGLIVNAIALLTYIAQQENW